MRTAKLHAEQIRTPLPPPRRTHVAARVDGEIACLQDGSQGPLATLEHVRRLAALVVPILGNDEMPGVAGHGDVGAGDWALEIRKAITSDEIARAVTIDEALLGSNERADYITSVAENGGLSVAALRGELQAFCCLDHGYFFGKPFISLLIVSPDARRLGLGAGLLSHNSSAYPEVWTSTNQSNSAMRKLLDKAGWRYCGELSGLDEGDPERFYRTA